MYVIHKGKPCVMVWSIERGEYVYIPERRWEKMTKEDRQKYRSTHMSTRFDLEYLL